VADVQLFVHADIAAVVQLAGVKVSALDESLGQHQGWARKLCVWKWQAFALDHRVTSIAHLGSARQANGRFALNSKYRYNVWCSASFNSDLCGGSARRHNGALLVIPR